MEALFVGTLDGIFKLVRSDGDMDVHSVVYDPVDPDLLYAATGGGENFPDPTPPPKGRPLYRYSARKKSWECITEGFQGKKNSRIMIHSDEIKWRVAENGLKSANLIDFRLGFQNTLANLAISEVPPGNQATEGHEHGEAYIYWLEGSGYSIVGEKRYHWGPGDAMYVPPETFHQHFVTSDVPARYLRIIPSPLLMNLLAIFASLGPYLKPEGQK